MKFIFFLLTLCCLQASTAQVGIGTTTPRQKLDINGKLNVGNDDTPPTEGAIRYNSLLNDFEGFNGTEWVSLTAGYKNAPVSFPATTNPFDKFGSAIAISEEYAVVGAPRSNWKCGGGTQTGRAYVYKKQNSVWQLHQDITPDAVLQADAGCYQEFGFAVAIDGNRLLVGCPGYNANNGTVFSYQLTAGQWNITHQFYPQTALRERFGEALDIRGVYAAIGAPGTGQASSSTGRAYMYKITTSGTASYALPNPVAVYTSRFGSVVAIDSNYLAVGAPAQEQGANPAQGIVYLYRNDGNDQYLATSILSRPAGEANDYFGASIDIDNNNMAIGCPNLDIGGVLLDVGAVFVLQKNQTGDFEQDSLSIIPNPSDGEFELFGYSVSLSENKLLIGAPGFHDINHSYTQYSGRILLYGRLPQQAYTFLRTVKTGNHGVYGDANLGFRVALWKNHYNISDPEYSGQQPFGGRTFIGDVRY